MKGEGSASSVQGFQSSAAIAIAALLMVLGFFSVIPSTHAATLDSQLDSSISPVVLDPSFGFYQPVFGETSGHSDTIAGFTVAFSSESPTYMVAMLWECISPLNIATESCAQVAVDSSRNPPSGNIPASAKEELVFTFPTPYTLNPSNYYYIYAGAGDFYPPNTFYGSSAGTHFYDGGGGVCGPGPHDRCPYSLYYQLFGVGGPDAPPSDFNPTATTTTPTCTENCNSSVLFLPGIEASRLYRPQVVGDPDKRLWEPGNNADVQDLYLNPDGSSVRPDVYTKEGDVINEKVVPVLGGNIYKSFIERMDALRADGKIADWEAAPYDWRLSLDDIVQYGHQVDDRIYYSGDSRATTTPYIIQELRRLAASSRTGKVTVIAHSNGGLVAKALTEALGTEASQLIDQIIFIAVPQAGTPMALPADLHGYKQAYLGGLVLSQNTARTFAQYAPMAYNLLPSAQYFTQVDESVISFDPSLPDWIARYGPVIHSAPSLHTFLADTYGRVDPQTGDINTPIQMSDTLLTRAENMHTDLDNWVPPVGVQLIQIAGWGVPTTVSGITYMQHGSGVTYDADTTIDGDGTVVVPSALWASTTTGAVNYWVDLKDYNKLLNRVTNLRLKTDHSNILEVSPLLDFLSAIIQQSTSTVPQYISITNPVAELTDHRLHFTLHSPLTLDMYDDQGRHTGVSTTTGEIEEQIPGTYYAQYGETKHIFSDATTTSYIVMEGYDTGTFTFNVDELQGDTLVASTTFQDIPTSDSTTVTLSAGSSGVSTLSSMRIDKNGDGSTDATIVPVLDGIATLDTIPPEIMITFATSTNEISFIGMDDVGTTTVTATTSYPILKKHQKEPKGIATTTVTVRDEAGNTTVLVYTEKLPSPEKRDTIFLEEIVYNGATTTLSNTTVSYKWRTDKNGLYKLFASHIKTSATSTESHYRPKKDETVIMIKPLDLDDSEDDGVDTRPVKQRLPGMIIPYLKTEQGRVIIGH